MHNVSANGATIPALGFGTFRMRGPNVLKVFPHALKVGFRHVDTAQIYGGLILGKGDRPKKRSTLYTDKGRVNRHIVPLIGSKLVQDMKAADLSKSIRDVASGKTAAFCRLRCPKELSREILRKSSGINTVSRRHPCLR